MAGFAKITEESWKDAIDTNLHAHFQLVHQVFLQKRTTIFHQVLFSAMSRGVSFRGFFCCVYDDGGD